MRLLRIGSDGRLRWAREYIGNERVPDYAILSHTWGEQEVIFNDLKELNNAEDIGAKSKAGWDKIRFCAQQTKRDGLDHFWVDTCCIDKSNSQELQEAINSMFRWYQNAKKCYVYLSDVNCNIVDADGESCRWKPAFRKSRWFTRGWTLQELLAPASVAFYSKEGELLGDKQSLKDTIHEITGIPVEALSGSRLSDFSVHDRFSWAKKRQTTREEDIAYCLLGIFDICMTLRYTEGKDRAMERLRRKIQRPTEDIEERLGKICSWLSAPDPSTNYHKAHKQRQAETGIWLLQNSRFAEWKERAASRLWLYGIPGCGKTILSSTIIEHLLQHCHDDASIVTAYFYFDFNDTQKQDPELMLRSLLSQLLQRSVTIPNGIDALFSACDNGQRQPSVHALLEVVPQVMQQFTHTYIVLDALDECTQRQELMDMLETVAGWQLDNVHLLMTSREERDIESSLESYVKEEDTICLQRDVVDRDIQRYVQQRLSDDKSLTKWNKDDAIRQEIETALMGGARGMFRWAACQLDTLTKCRNRAMLRNSLSSLPLTLDMTYDRILCAITKEDSLYAIRVLRWLAVSARPLYLEEVAEIIAIDVDREPAFKRDEVLEDPLDVLDICSSLIVKQETWPGKHVVVLAHYSVKEYLVSTRCRQGPAARYGIDDVVCHNVVARSCLEYLLRRQHINTRTDDCLRVSKLARFSAEFWISHAKMAGAESEPLGRLMAELFSTANTAFANWIRTFDIDSGRSFTDVPETSRSPLPTPLYYAARFGLTTVVNMLLQSEVDVNACGGLYGNALVAASSGGYDQVVAQILETHADVNALGGQHGSALHVASKNGHEKVVKLLLADTDVELNLEDGNGSTPLVCATTACHTSIMRLLLERGADVNSPDHKGRSSLSLAAEMGYEAGVELLLLNGADFEQRDCEGRTPLSWAACGHWHGKTTSLLLEKGANTMSRDSLVKWTPSDWYNCYSTYHGGGACKWLFRELRDMRRNPLPNISADVVGADILSWQGTILGPSCSPYSGGTFFLSIRFPTDYPFKPPRVHFTTRIYHPNINTNGYISVDLLSSGWAPSMTIGKVLLSICSIFDDPLLDYPFNTKVAHMYLTDRTRYEATARSWTRIYAI